MLGSWVVIMVSTCDLDFCDDDDVCFLRWVMGCLIIFWDFNGNESGGLEGKGSFHPPGEKFHF